jgi:hypothetical protein
LSWRKKPKVFRRERFFHRRNRVFETTTASLGVQQLERCRSRRVDRYADGNFHLDGGFRNAQNSEGVDMTNFSKAICFLVFITGGLLALFPHADFAHAQSGPFPEGCATYFEHCPNGETCEGGSVVLASNCTLRCSLASKIAFVFCDAP